MEKWKKVRFMLEISGIWHDIYIELHFQKENNSDSICEWNKLPAMPCHIMHFLNYI